MKVGIRKPSIKRSVKARTTGRIKREIKSVNPLYGAKGMGLVNDPKKAIYNKVYNKTSVGVPDVAKVVLSDDYTYREDTDNQFGENVKNKAELSNATYKKLGLVYLILGILLIVASLLVLLISVPVGIIGVIIGIISIMFGRRYRNQSKD